MQFQKTTEYAIRILHYMHHYPYKGDVLTVQMISDAIGLPHSTVVPIVVRLRKNGLVNVVHGRNGGYRLAKPGHTISLYDVIWAVEGDKEHSNWIKAYRQGLHNQEAEHPVLQDYFREVQEGLVEKLSSKSIADIELYPQKKAV